MCFENRKKTQSYKAFKEEYKQTYSQNRSTALRLTIGGSSESSQLMSLPIGKGDCIIKGFKMKLKISLSPSNAKR